MGKENVLRPARGMKIVAALGASALLTMAAAACGEAPSTSPSASAPAAGTFSTCMVTDIGGIDDRSFNASSWQGLKNAKAASTKLAEPKNVSSKAEADYVPNLTQFVQQNCNFILAVGGLMGNATSQVAKANPNQQFAIVD